jgi:hypothetical protein
MAQMGFFDLSDRYASLFAMTVLTTESEPDRRAGLALKAM